MQHHIVEYIIESS